MARFLLLFAGIAPLLIDGTMVRRWSQVGFCTGLVQQLQRYDNTQLLDACQAALDSNAQCQEAQQVLMRGGRPFQQESIASACQILISSWSARPSRQNSDTEQLLLARQNAELRQSAVHRGQQAASAKEELDRAIGDKRSRYAAAPEEALPPYNISVKETDAHGKDLNLDDEDFVTGQTFTPRTTTTAATTTQKSKKTAKGKNATGANQTHASNGTSAKVTSTSAPSTNATTSAPSTNATKAAK